MMKIRYRIYDHDCPALPVMGDYLMSERGRGGYLILGADDRGARGGLGQPIFRLVVLTVERVSRAECLSHQDRLWSIKWDRRKRRASRRLGAVA